MPTALAAAPAAARAKPIAPPATSSAPVGSCWGCHGSSECGTSGGTGVRSNITVARSTPLMPSISAWWVLLISAKPPSSSPSMIHISHSGLERSSCWDMIRATRRISWSSEPGDGSAVWRTWYSRLNVGSSTHSGRPVSIGGCASRWR